MKRTRPEPIPSSSPLRAHHEEISRCVKCGSCAAVCPTYLLERDESYSTRGRMALVNAVLEERLAVSGIYKDRLATCTTCLACEASCPSAVPVTKIIQAAKEQAVAESGMGIIGSVIAATIKQPLLIRAAAWLAPVALHYSKSRGAGAKGQGAGGTRIKGQRLGERIGSSTFNVQRSKGTARRGKVVFFPGCAISYFHPDIGEATIRVLNAIGYDVIVPDGLQCCGRPLLSLGDRRSAGELAAQNTAIFEAARVDAILTACASCGLMFKKDYPDLLRSGAKTPVVLDIHEFLLPRIATVELSPLCTTVAIHDPCHLGRGQGLSRTVRDLLQAIPGLTLAEMRDPDRCCGFGGVMRLTHRKLSDGIADTKAKNILETSAKVVATGCPGCRMQIAEALKQRDSDIAVVHPVQLLDDALCSPDESPRDAESVTAGARAAGARPAK